MEQFNTEVMHVRDAMFRPASFTPPPELYAASELRLLRLRGGISLPLNSGRSAAHFIFEMSLTR